MRRLILFSVALIAAAVLLPAVASAKPVVESATAYSSNGTVISGWAWLRNFGADASWTFTAANAQAAHSGSVYLLFTPLVTNKASGGSGYSRTIRVVLHSDAHNGRTVNRTVRLMNPFRPKDPTDSGGIGYQTYGWVNVPSSIWKGATAINVTYTWTKGYHVAVRQEALQLAYRVA